MNIVCSKEELLKGVTIVQKAVPTRTTMSILECILIDATDDEIKLTANDMEIGIETVVNGKIIEGGVVAIEAKFLSDVVRKLPDNDISIITDDNYSTKIICEDINLNYDIVGKSGDDFAKIPFISRNEPIVISQFALKELIKQTIFSTADNDSNKMMKGELFEINDNNLKVVALDGHRLAIRNIELKDNYESKKVVVPAKTLNEISKIIPGFADEMVNIFITDNNIIFEFDNTIVVSRLIDGEYFKLDNMLSTDYKTKIKINKRQLLDSIDRASLMAKEGDKKPIIMDINDININLSITSVMGSMNENISIDKEGIDMRIGFNPKFFMDALKVIDDEEIIMYMVDPKAPCYIRDDNETFIYMILPININSARKFMENIKIKDEYIKLGQLLKLAGLVGSGVDAKYVINEGLVKINDEVDTRRGKKIYPGDIVSYNGETIKVE